MKKVSVHAAYSQTCQQKLLSLTALANVKRFDAAHAARHVSACTQKLFRTKHCHRCFHKLQNSDSGTAEKNKASCHPEPGSYFYFNILFRCHGKSKKEVFFVGRVAQEDMINNTSGLRSADWCCCDFNKSVEKKLHRR